jgi:hypothetical protein
MTIELPDDLVGRRLMWARAPHGTPQKGLVVADFRGKRTEDILTRRPTVSMTVVVEDARGQSHHIPWTWIVEVSDV